MAQFVITDGVHAKSINPWNLEDRPEAWTWVSNAPQSELDAMYYKVAASYRAVNKRAIAAANVPFAIKKGEEVVDDSTAWKNELKIMAKPKDLIRRVSMSQTFTNKAYLLRGKDVLGNTKALNFLVPTSITEVTDPVTGLLKHFERRINTQLQVFQPDDENLIKLWLLDHTTELLPSKNTAAQAMFNAVGGVYFQDLFIRSFYERGGVKQHVLAVKGAIWSEGKDEIERGWSRFLKGWSKFASKILNADTMDVKPIGTGVDDLKNNDIYRQNIENIALAVGMPTSHLLSDWDSYATASVDYMMWQRDDVFPHVEAIAEDLNIQVFEPLGYTLEFQTEQSDAETADEVERAKAYEIYVGAGIKPSIAAQMVGIELPEGVEYDALDAMAEEKKKEEEAKQQADRDQQMALQQAKQPVDDKPKPKAPAKWVPSLDEFKELKVWQDVALRRHKKGESLDFAYQPHYGGLPDGLTDSIRTALLGAVSADDIKAAFIVGTADIETETHTPAARYSIGEIAVLADSINNLAKAYKSDPVVALPAPAPNIYVNTPPINITATMPQPGEPSITFSPNILPSEVSVNVTNEVQPAAVENVVNVQPAKVVIHEAPEVEKTVQVDVKRDAEGRITSAKGKIKDGK